MYSRGRCAIYSSRIATMSTRGDGQPCRGFILLGLEILGIPSTSMTVLCDLVC